MDALVELVALLPVTIAKSVKSLCGLGEADGHLLRKCVDVRK
jgi:hypothetical protein